jgi:predicted DNA repair protein MutK
LAHGAAGIVGVGGVLAALLPTVLDGVTGIIAGALALIGVTLISRVTKGKEAAA